MFKSIRMWICVPVFCLQKLCDPFCEESRDRFALFDSFQKGEGLGNQHRLGMMPKLVSDRPVQLGLLDCCLAPDHVRLPGVACLPRFVSLASKP